MVLNSSFQRLQNGVILCSICLTYAKNYEPPKSYDNKRILILVFDDGSLKKFFI